MVRLTWMPPDPLPSGAFTPVRQLAGSTSGPATGSRRLWREAGVEKPCAALLRRPQMLCTSCLSSSTNSIAASLGWRNPVRRQESLLRRRFLGRALNFVTLRVSSSLPPINGDDPTVRASPQLEYDPSSDLLGFDVVPQLGNLVSDTAKLRSWFGPNGQYIRELPCPSCRGRGYTPCPECGIERSRIDCSECKGKGIKTCQQCFGDRVIWEESIDERPWEKAQSSSPFKVEEDIEVDNLDIKVDVTRKSKRVYQSPSPEVSLKISRSLRDLNAKTGLFSKRMRILHRNPTLHAQRVAAIKKSKGTETARKQASETMKAYFSNPENRYKRSIAMKGVKFRCSHCGEEGHRRYYCPLLISETGKRSFRCRSCGNYGHNRRTCGRSSTIEEHGNRDGGQPHRCKICSQIGHNRRTCPHLTTKSANSDSSCGKSSTTEECNNKDDGQTYHRCKVCSQTGHNRRTCPYLTRETASSDSYQLFVPKLVNKRTYSCNFCLKKGHNIRTCPDKKSTKGLPCT